MGQQTCPCPEGDPPLPWAFMAFLEAATLLCASVSPREPCLWPAEGEQGRRRTRCEIPSLRETGKFSTAAGTLHIACPRLAAGQQKGEGEGRLDLRTCPTIPLGMWSSEPATGSAPQTEEGPEPLTDAGVSSPCWGLRSCPPGSAKKNKEYI